MKRVSSSSSAATALLIALPLVKLAIHLAVGGGYGYHGDEMYYLDCADHLDWSYVDHPPLSIVVLAAIRALAGNSVIAIRSVPALAGALTVFVVGLMTRRLGGGTFAMALAMVATIAAPFYLFGSSYFSMNALDFLVWATVAWLVIRILSAESSETDGASIPTHLWIALGILIGIGVQNKISVLWLSGGLFAGLMLTPQRALLRTRGPWLAAGIALLFLIPQIAWQFTHDFATLRWMKGAAEDRPSAPVVFLARQFDGMLRTAAPVWLAGLAFYFVLPQGRRYRTLGWAWLAVGALFTFGAGSRPYYLAPAYAWLIAGGAVAIETWSKKRWLSWVRVAYLAAIVISGAKASLMALPILPQAQLAAAYAPLRARDGGGRFQDKLPEFLSQMSGFDQIVGQLADVYDSLPATEKDRAMMLVAYYPIAGAIDVLGRARGLPLASSSNNSYWLWGPQGSWTGPIIALGYPERLLRELFVQVDQVAETHCDYCREPPHAVWVARGLQVPPDALWRRLKNRE